MAAAHKLAAAANALDLPVERRVLLVHGVVRVGEIFLVRNVAGLGLAMTDRRGQDAAATLRSARRPHISALRKGAWRADQRQKRHGDDCLFHTGPPVSDNATP